MKKYLVLISFSFLIIFSSLAEHQNEPYSFNRMWKYKINKSENYHKFEFDLQNNKLSKKVEEQLKNKKTTNLVSYLLYEDGKIKIDQQTKSKYGKYYPSHSIGKSLVSVVTGYAVCGGYIDSVYSNIDYPTVENTLYENQKLLNLLNMTAGDQLYLGEMWGGQDSKMNSNGKSINTIPIKNAMKRYFKNKPGSLPGVNFNYSAMTTNVIVNYVIYKTSDDWNKLLNKIFVEDAKVKNKVYFGKTLVRTGKNKVGNRKSG